MNNNLVIKFDLQTETSDCAYSLMEVIMNKLKGFQNLCKDLKYIEINLLKPEESDMEHKTALFRIVSNDSTITEYSRSKRWEDALLNAFDRIERRFITA
ncbi:MAG TPA: hypothetical protein VLC28_15880 [Flavitalea sp.]|nr:hypothetical protein [Flavitalea sp.]